MMQIFDTLSQRKRRLRPKKDKVFNVFVCGPTVYELSHIGHARTYIAFDAFVKYLGAVGYDVFYLQNITDIDDKIIARAKERNESPRSLARQFEREYFQDMKILGVDSVTKYARATDHISEIISQVERLLKKGYAYEIKGDGIYYDIKKFKQYGKLSHRTTEQAEDSTSRIDESVQKRNRGDFALWKFSNPSAGGEEPKWKSPWGMGRPGWHIEDTAITENYFGSQYDIHGGARDLIFPHHEAEIAQIEAVSDRKPMANYWMHTGFLTVKGEKMSKSLGNYVTIRDFLVKSNSRTLRFLILKSHYRSPIDHSEGSLLQTERELDRIDEFVDRLSVQKQAIHSEVSAKKLLGLSKKEFSKALQDDFNTPLAVSVLFEYIRKANSLIDEEQLGKGVARDILTWLEEIDGFLGFIFWGRKKDATSREVKKLLQEREQLRNTKQWQQADEVRLQIERLGWQVDDTPKGPKLKKLKQS